jgi:hypothetical protein
VRHRRGGPVLPALAHHLSGRIEGQHLFEQRDPPLVAVIESSCRRISGYSTYADATRINASKVTGTHPTELPSARHDETGVVLYSLKTTEL